MRQLRATHPLWVYAARVPPKSGGSVLLPEALLGDRTQRVEIAVLCRDAMTHLQRLNGLREGALITYRGHLRYAGAIARALAEPGDRAATRDDDRFLLHVNDVLSVVELPPVRGTAPGQSFGEYNEYPLAYLREVQAAYSPPGRRRSAKGGELSRIEFRIREAAYAWVVSQGRGTVSKALREEVIRMGAVPPGGAETLLPTYVPLDESRFHSAGRRGVSWYVWVPLQAKEGVARRLHWGQEQAERTGVGDDLTLTQVLLAALWRVSQDLAAAPAGVAE